MANTGTITLSAINNGPSADPAAVISDDTTAGFNAHITYTEPFAVTYGGGATGPATVTAAVLTAGFAVNMPVGGTAVISMPFTTASVTGPNGNTAFIGTSLDGGNDLNPSNNSSSITASIRAKTADLRINKVSSASTYMAGDSGFFTITATNDGPDPVPGSRFTDALPAGILTYGTGLYPITYGGGATGPDTAISKASLQSPGVIVSNWPVGGTITVVVPFMANAAGTITNTATVNPPSGFVDPPGNNTSSSTVTVTAPPARTVNIDTHKLQVTPSSISVGLNNAFHNNYVNNGPDAADGVTVKDAPGPGYNGTWIINQTTGITVSYTGGATGPATLTLTQLLNGFVVPVWPVGGTVDVHYSIYGQQAGTGNENCATAIAAPGMTLTGFNTDCFDFPVLGTANCNCSSSYSVTPSDIFLGNQYTAAYTLPPDGPCCSLVSFKAIQYPSEPDAVADTNGVFSGQGSVTCATAGTSGTFPFTPGQAGFYRFYIVVDVTTPAQSCSISDNGVLFGNPPLQSLHQAAISGNWPYHHVI